MIKKSFIIGILLIVISGTSIISACDRVGSAMTGTGTIIDQKIKVTDFTRIDVQGAFNVEIIEGDNFSVVVSTDDNLVNRILVSREEETLKIRIQAPANFFPTSLKVTITMPRIYSLFLSGGVKASLSGFKSTFNFNLKLSEGSTLNGFLESGITEFMVSNASQIKLKGGALELILDASGASKLDLGEFVVGSSTTNLKEETEAIMNVNEEFNVTLNDASKIYYIGNPSLFNASISGGSFMKPK